MYKLYFNFASVRTAVDVTRDQFYDVLSTVQFHYKVKLVRKNWYTFFYLDEPLKMFNPDDCILIGSMSNTMLGDLFLSKKFDQCDILSSKYENMLNEQKFEFGS